ncbi:hypothetical protein D3C87_1070440 [compost metagenome]
MSSKINKVTVNNFSASKIKVAAPASKTIQTDKGELKFYTSEIFYDYSDDPNIVRLDKLQIQCPKMISDQGIAKNYVKGKDGKPNHNEKPTYSCRSNMDPTMDEYKPYIKVMDEMYAECYKQSLEYLNNYRLDGLKLTVQSFSGMFTNKLMIKKLDNNGVPVPGYKFSQYFNLNPGVNGSKFYGLDGKPIDWELLTGTKITHYPLLVVNDIFFGSTAISIRAKAKSFVVSDIEPVAGVKDQADTIDNIIGSNQLVVDEWLDKLNVIKGIKKDEQELAKLENTNFSTPSKDSAKESGSVTDIITGAVSQQQQAPVQHPVEQATPAGYGYPQATPAGYGYPQATPNPNMAYGQPYGNGYPSAMTPAGQGGITNL